MDDSNLSVDFFKTFFTIIYLHFHVIKIKKKNSIDIFMQVKKIVSINSMHFEYLHKWKQLLDHT